MSQKHELYSLRVNRSYRMPGVVQDKVLNLVWIGHHDEYKKLIARYQ